MQKVLAHYIQRFRENLFRLLIFVEVSNPLRPCYKVYNNTPQRLMQAQNDIALGLRSFI